MALPVKINGEKGLATMGQWTPDQVELIKHNICRGASDDEFKMFLHVCQHTRLDPFLKQIYLVPRYDSNLKKNIFTTQVSIDGARLVAERTGNYCPGKESTFTYDKDGKLMSATAYVKKMTKDGTWHEISSTAFWTEYVQTKREGDPTLMWATKSHIMLSKCAEALALRKAFPNDLSGVYVEEEMQKDSSPLDVKQLDNEKLEPGQVMQLSAMLEGCDEYKEKLCGFYKVINISMLPARDFDKIYRSAQKFAESVETPAEV